jgi:hypothetical protein
MQRYSVDHAVQAACVLATQVLSAHPSGLVTDLDGTISPIASAPEQARVLPGCRRALERLRGRLDLVAVVSGRRGTEARGLVGVEGIVYLGNHGLDPWIGGNSPLRAGEQAARAGRYLERRWTNPMEVSRGEPGLRLEDKGVTVASTTARLPTPARRAGAAAATNVGARHALAWQKEEGGGARARRRAGSGRRGTGPRSWSGAWSTWEMTTRTFTPETLCRLRQIDLPSPSA